MFAAPRQRPVLMIGGDLSWWRRKELNECGCVADFVQGNVRFRAQNGVGRDRRAVNGFFSPAQAPR